MSEEIKMSEQDLVVEGIKVLDDALSYFMDMEGETGKVIAHFLHAALTIAEKLLTPVDAQ